jgi:hypothetical protein
MKILETLKIKKIWPWLILIAVAWYLAKRIVG